MGREKNTEGLCIICTGLGIADEDENGNVRGYKKTDYCLDNVKDLQRFLRRDDPQQRDVFKQICRWNTVSRDLVPIIEYYQSDRNLVINAVKILVFLTMPVDSSSDDVAHQIEYLWDLKAALTRNVTIAVIVSLLEEPLSHLESGTFSEDDWKLVQLVLTLVRNILAIQGITVQQKASGSATQFLHLTERILELMFQENIMDLILVLAQHVDDPDGYLRQDNLLLLEIFHYIFLGQDPELVAKSSTNSKVNADSTISTDSLRLIIEEEDEKRRAIRQKNQEYHPQFNGTFTRVAMDGSKMLFKGNPASANGLAKVRKIPRGRLKKVAPDNGVMALQEDNILELLHTFLNQFLAGGYNDLMQTVREDIIKEHQDIQNSDIITFFQVAHFITTFHHKIILTKTLRMENVMHESSINSQSMDYLSLHHDVCGPIAATMNEAMFSLVISKWRETFEGVKMTNEYKFLTAAGSLFKSMIRMIDLVLKYLPEDSKACQIARVLLYKLFYDQTDGGLTQFLLNLFKCFDSHKQPKSDLADLLEIIHIMLRLMEKLEAHGTLRVSKKLRRRRKMKNKDAKDQNEVEPRLMNEQDITHELIEPTSEMCVDLDKLAKEKLSELNSVEREWGFNQDGSSNLRPAVMLGMPLQNMEHLHDHSSPQQDDKESEKPADKDYETDSSSSNDKPMTNEVNFNISALVSSFASNTVIHNLCWLLKHYKANSSSTNHYIVCMLRRFCEDLELSPLLYQLSLLSIFHDILAEHKACKSREYTNIINFLTKFIRKMLKMMKSQPLLFVEILFWKTHRECQYINAEALMGNIVNLRRDIRNMDSGIVDSMNCHGDMSYVSIADALGEDEIDLDLPQMHHDQRMEQLSDAVNEDDFVRTKRNVLKKSSIDYISENKIDKDISEITPPRSEAQGTLRRDCYTNLTQEQDTMINELYEKYKNEHQCSRLVAEALDPDGKISPAFISRKLKQLGLKVVPKKKLVKTTVPFPARGDPTVSGSAVNASTSLDLNESGSTFLPKNPSRRKRIRAFSEEEEVQITILYEKFKDHKKRNVMIANALDPNNKFTAAKVSRKLKQLGLLPHKKRSRTSVKDMEGIEVNETHENSDEETLLAIRERSNRKRRMMEMHATEMSTDQLKATPQEIDSEDVVLSSLFKDAAAKRQMKPSEQDDREAVQSEAVDINESAVEVSRGNHYQNGEMSESNKHVQVGLVELEDLLDSGDDMGTVAPRKMGFRKRMVVDFDEDG